jgi:hypothetical protein
MHYISPLLSGEGPGVRSLTLGKLAMIMDEKSQLINAIDAILKEILNILYQFLVR